MISVTILQNRNNEYVGFKTNGHAGFDESGKDIICSAVSVLVINTINSIEKLTETRFRCNSDEKYGIIDFKFEGSASKEASLLMESMILGIKSISEQYGRSYVTLIIKEV